MCYMKTITKAQPVAIEFIKGSTTKKRQNETDAKTLSKEVFLFINDVEYEENKKNSGRYICFTLLKANFFCFITYIKTPVINVIKYNKARK